MNNDNFLIENTDLDLAKSVTKFISEPDVRNQAVANAVAAIIAKKYFSEIDVDTESGLYNVPHVFKGLDISDIYIKDAYINVRIYFNDNELCVPKVHFDRNILPIAYMFIKLDPDVSGGLVTGFLPPNAVDTSVLNSGYYKVNESDLVSFYDVDSLIGPDYDNTLPEDYELQIFDFLDNKHEDPNAFLNMLFKSREAREKFIDSANAKMLFNYISLNTTNVSNSDILDEAPILNSEESLDLGGEVADVELLEPDVTIEDSLDISLDESLEPINDIDAVEEFEDLSVEPLSIIDESDSLLEEPISEELEPQDLISIADSKDKQEEEPLFTTNEELTNNDSNIDFVNLNNDSTPVTIDIQVPDHDDVESDIVDLGITEESDAIISPIDIIDTIEEINDETAVCPDDQGALPEVDYTTSVTPSISDYDEEVQINDLEHMLDNEIPQPEQPVEHEMTEAEEQIDDLFASETYDSVESKFVDTQKKTGSPLPIIGVVAVIGALGYFGYTKFFSQTSVPNKPVESVQSQPIAKRKKVEQKQEPVAMPIETVENVKQIQASEEGNALSVPAIEQNLDASILVSNLSVNWEVPEGYIANSTAKRYFTKIGKIIQLHLKADLLLLNKPPITNKISLELELNKDTGKFEIKSFIDSSGEKSVDDLIKDTVSKVLDMKLSMNLSTLNSIAGNPVLIIRL